MESPNCQSVSFPAQSRRISVQLANLGRGLAYNVTASWTQLRQEQSGSHSAYSFQRQEKSEHRGPDETTPEDSSSAAEVPPAEGEVSPAKSSSQRHMRHSVTGYARHAALVVVFLMICVALAVLIAYRMTFGSDDMFASTRGITGEAYPSIVVPKLRETPESLSEFKKWIRDLLDQVQETPRNSSLPEETHEDTVATTHEVSSVASYQTTSIATIEETSNSTLEETTNSTLEETSNSTLEETSNSTLEGTLMTAGNETMNATAVIYG
ncbi:hypothetical protein V5799_018171 [Amblyomma americanum]|uniref:Uncharacterized protein n=1 Tax=Amblyomma americanum TaxID=6943 RepID=A0AAQ4F188_AMBAM